MKILKVICKCKLSIFSLIEPTFWYRKNCFGLRNLGWWIKRMPFIIIWYQVNTWANLRVIKNASVENKVWVIPQLWEEVMVRETCITSSDDSDHRDDVLCYNIPLKPRMCFVVISTDYIQIQSVRIDWRISFFFLLMVYMINGFCGEEEIVNRSFNSRYTYLASLRYKFKSQCVW